MELRTNYQYTYFVHPFVIKENKYKNYIMKLLSDKRCKFKVLKKESDIELYKHFTKEVREVMFGTFGFSSKKIKMLQELPLEAAASLIKNYPCSIFEFNLEDEIQGTTENQNGIFFKIQKFEVICFNTGVCFLTLKTTIEDTEKFTDILNFNYKFRDINEDLSCYSNYDNIRLQTDTFSDVNKLAEFIKEVTGSSFERLDLELENERFFTYSYACVDQREWDKENDFRLLEDSFIKQIKVVPADVVTNYTLLKEENLNVFSKWRFAKMAITKQAVALFSSTADPMNYCILPIAYENQYLYTYILTMYKKLYIKKIAKDFTSPIQRVTKKARKDFVEFTKKIWVQEVSEDEIGTIFEYKLRETLEVDALYEKLKNEYDLVYKEMKIEKKASITILITIVLGISLIFNVLNYMALSAK